MNESVLEGFERHQITVGDDNLSVHVGGEGKPLLFLHGYPQTYATWSKIAPVFAQQFKCVAVDLPGYGQSSIPSAQPAHAAFSKRHMAEMLVETMSTLGFAKYGLLSHDRGARVAYRMALDHKERIEKLGIIEVVPTGDMWRQFNAEMALKAYHWTFLAQPHPLPETLIAADPIAYLDWTLQHWTMSKSLDVFAPQALESYRDQFRDPNRVHAMCEDYRAGAGIDRKLDDADRNAGRMISAPLHFVWSKSGFPAETGDPLSLWRNWATNITGNAVVAGHFAQEENPEAIIKSFMPFFLNG